MNEAQILKWAAGAPEDITDIGSIDVQALLRLIAAHHLHGRFVTRVGLEHPRWVPRTLSLGAWKLLDRARQALRRQAEAVRGISEALGADAVPPVVIKGISTYALTGDSRNVRVGGDVDLLADDPERLWAAMTGLGYVLTRDKDEHGAEYAVMIRDGLEVEIHRYFPAWAYPEGLADADLRPAHNPGVWEQPFGDVRLTKIDRQDLADDIETSAAQHTPGLTVPGPTTMTLVLCAHLFRHYAEGRPHPAPVVRLGELADVHDLIGHARFSRERFEGLVSRLHAEDAVRFVRCVSRLCLAADPFAWLDAEEVHPEPGAALPFPMQLSPWSGWGALLTPDELLRPLAPGALFDRLGPNVVTAGVGQDEAPARIIVQSPQGEQMPLRLSVTWDPVALHVGLRIPAPLPSGCRYQALLYDPSHWNAGTPPGTLPDSICWAEAGHDQPEQTQRFEHGGDAAMHLNGEGCEAQFALPWAALPPGFAAHGSGSVMVVVMRLQDGQPPNVRFREDILMLIPLHVQLHVRV